MFKPLVEILHTSIPSVVYMESQIEVRMFNAFQASKKYVLVPDGQTPEGEGLFLMPQKSLPPYRADFIIKAIGYQSAIRVWPPKKKVYIDVECDGKEFHSSTEQKAHDAERDEFFAKKGIKTFRYSGSEIYKNADFIVNDLANYLQDQVFRP